MILFVFKENEYLHSRCFRNVEHYISENFKTSSESAAYLVISFPGSWFETDWFVTKPFGETKIDLAHFPLLKSVGNDETALVNQAFLNRFDRLFKFFSIISEDSIRDSVSCEFYSTVMKNAATVTRHVACNLMGSTNLLLETMTNFVELSPYRPFRTYIFCNAKRFTQLSEVANESIVQHLAYEAELEESLGMQNVVYLNKLDDLPLSLGDAPNTDIATALDSLGLGVRARLCLRAAGELEKQKERNEEKIKKEIQKKAVASMRDLEEYKATCEKNKGKGYYDAFKVQKEEKDFQANVKRLVLAGVWDEIIEMLKRYKLPDEFEGKKEWIELGTRFRRLVEPLDIANYYGHLKNEDTGPYMNKARPKRYR
ncbi:hypothetical protein KIW84_053267 [Lathyrus oleraceus]|uniref:EDS1 EP domain-containing protein n=1 Tax=Pisum sativum TaxID=3888 RepID=A0A9D4WSA4_PEA|nr:hypothetical protein KIW84_053267 [Pisum sativum]